jgi:hypothetical protein
VSPRHKNGRIITLVGNGNFAVTALTGVTVNALAGPDG